MICISGNTHLPIHHDPSASEHVAAHAKLWPPVSGCKPAEQAVELCCMFPPVPHNMPLAVLTPHQY
jgi:hypothetical protein